MGKPTSDPHKVVMNRHIPPILMYIHGVHRRKCTLIYSRIDFLLISASHTDVAYTNQLVPLDIELLYQLSYPGPQQYVVKTTNCEAVPNASYSNFVSLPST